MKNSLIYELPKIVDEGNKEVARILRRLENDEPVRFTKPEYIHPNTTQIDPSLQKD